MDGEPLVPRSSVEDRSSLDPDWRSFGGGPPFDRGITTSSLRCYSNPKAGFTRNHHLRSATVAGWTEFRQASPFPVIRICPGQVEII